MNPEEKVRLNNITIMVDGEVIGSAESISATVEMSKCENKDVNLNFPKSYEGTFEVEYIDEEFFEALGLNAWQKAIMRRELRKQQLDQSKEKKLGMRESMNKHFKRGRKW